ncbi:MAG TPA: Brp/Blh family beta-carotene 15,15'-dioxygenase [Cryomorphaceae bacterium]|nr:Brp/Blh family beta-carotene 15,15'-dioxygenase [Cryomorphaceae bacterium]
MNKTTFVFVASFFVAVAFFAGFEGIAIGHQTICAAIFIALLGIPHGAIDHIIYLEGNGSNPFKFYSFYFGLMTVYAIAWIFFPMWSMLGFLALSAYHFGQSQFTELAAIPERKKIILYISWGTSILAGLIYFNRIEIADLTVAIPDLAAVSVAFENVALYQTITISAAILTCAILVDSFRKDQITSQRFAMELYTFAFIHFVFYALPLVVGFTLYFVFLHSSKVLIEEFAYLRKMRVDFSLKKFVRLLLPYTLVSLIGSGLLLAISMVGAINISAVLLSFILISVLTLPHSVVMENFYSKLAMRNDEPV